MQIESYGASNHTGVTSSQHKRRNQQQITCNINEDVRNKQPRSSVDSLEMADQMQKSQGAMTHRNNIFVSLKNGRVNENDQRARHSHRRGDDMVGSSAKLKLHRPLLPMNYQYNSQALIP